MVKISVIIPVYNVEDYLRECLDSVINQTLDDIEIICVNDGSTDGSLDILNSYDDGRIRIISQENRGLSASRNVGLDNATGDYICFLDSDDYLKLTALEELYPILEEKSLDFVMFKLRDFDNESGEELENPYFDMVELKKIVKDNVFSHEDVGKPIFHTSVSIPGKIFRHDFIKDMKFPEGLIFEDNPFFTEAMLKARRIFIYDEYLYFRRIRKGSITNSSTERFWEWLIISDMIIDITKKYGFYEEYGEIIYNKKFSNTFRIFKEVDDKDKSHFFEMIRKNYLELGEKCRDDEVFNGISSRLRFIYNAGVTCETSEEFEFTINNYDLKNTNNKIRKSNAKLKDEIDEYEKINNALLNSTSWKSTDSLRKFRKMFREDE